MRNRKARYLIMLAAATAMAICGTAQATSYGTLTATWGGVNSGCEVHYVNSPMNDGNIYVGRYSLKNVTQATVPPVPVLPSVLQIYCIDTYQWANTGTTTYDVRDLADGPAGNGAPAMGATKAAYLEDLIYHHYSAAVSSADKAVFAAAVWEIVYEEPVGTWNINSGNVMETGWSTAQQTLASSWLGSLSTHDHGNTAYALISTTAQDFAIALGGGYDNPIPEPVTMAGLALGLCTSGAYVSKRRKG